MDTSLQKTLGTFTRWIKFMDVGEVKPTFTVENNCFYYRSLSGGLISSLFFVFSLCYTFYMITQWEHGDIRPKVQVSSRAAKNYTYDLNGSHINFYILQPHTNIDPFDDKHKILIPFFHVYKNINPINKLDYLENQTPSSTQYYSRRIGLDGSLLTKNLPLIHNQNKETQADMQETQVLVFFARCDKKHLKQNQSCANDSIIDSYLQTPMLQIHFQIILRQYDISTGQYGEEQKTYYFFLDQLQTQYSQVVLTTKYLQIQYGQLVQKTDHHTSLSKAEISSQTLDQSYIQRMPAYKDLTIYSLFLIRLDTIQEIEIISYPNLGEIFAQIGSIIGLICLLKPLLVFLNERGLKHQISENIIKNLSEEEKIVSDITKQKVEKMMNIFEVHKSNIKISQAITDVQRKVHQLSRKIKNKVYDEKDEIKDLFNSTPSALGGIFEKSFAINILSDSCVSQNTNNVMPQNLIEKSSSDGSQSQNSCEYDIYEQFVYC